MAARRKSGRPQVQSLSARTPVPQPEAVVEPFFCVALIPVRFLGRVPFEGKNQDALRFERAAWCLVWDPLELSEYVWGVEPPITSRGAGVDRKMG